MTLESDSLLRPLRHNLRLPSQCNYSRWFILKSWGSLSIGTRRVVANGSTHGCGAGEHLLTLLAKLFRFLPVPFEPHLGDYNRIYLSTPAGELRKSSRQSYFSYLAYGRPPDPAYES